jgi:hypothetical protein
MRTTPELEAVANAAERLHDTEEAQLIELIVTSGWYGALSQLVDAARVELEPWAARVPERTAT